MIDFEFDLQQWDRHARERERADRWTLTFTGVCPRCKGNGGKTYVDDQTGEREYVPCHFCKSEEQLESGGRFMRFPVEHSHPKLPGVKKFLVEWEEVHVYRYMTTIEARSAKEARAILKASSEYDDERSAEFDRVKSVGRKRVSPL